MELFEASAHPDWQWFEEELSYDNAKLAHALIVSGHATGQPAVLERGLEALRWLTELQMSEKGHFRPVGSNGFYRRGGTRANFDQQPIEAHATVSACLEAYRATADVWWYEQAQRAFDWFIGWNDLGLELYSPETGGCRDGLHVDRVNGNQGAESTLAFLLSLAEMQLAQNMLTSFKEPIAISGLAANPHVHAPQTYSHNPQSRPVPRSPAALQSRVVPSGSPGSSPGSWRSRKTGPAGCWTKFPLSFLSDTSTSAISFWNASNRSASLWRRVEDISEQRRLLIGSYFLAEYSLESAALFNPSIVPHPDQTGLAVRRSAVHSQLARHRGRTHFFHHVSNRYHPSRSADRGIARHWLSHRAASDPKPRVREGAVRAKTL